MTDPIDEAVEIAASLCRSFEGLRLKPYLCPAGYPTIGYGTVWKPDGTQVKLDDPPITKQKAEEWLISELTRSYLPGVLRASPGLISNPRALGAITDFAYNLGVGRYRSSTLRRRINEKDWDGAVQEIVKWNKAGGRILPGLVKRRQAEAVLMR